jgi:hypothetical protein
MGLLYLLTLNHSIGTLPVNIWLFIFSLLGQSHDPMGDANKK